MKIEFTPDRVVRRPDPVEAATGVFAHLTQDELSASERARLGRVVPADPSAPMPLEIEITSKPTEAPKEWSPKAIFTRLTALYARFFNPAQSSKETRDE